MLGGAAMTKANILPRLWEGGRLPTTGLWNSAGVIGSSTK